MEYRYRDLIQIYNKEEIEDMARFGILERTKTGNSPRSSSFYLKISNPISILKLKRKEWSNQILADQVIKEWKWKAKEIDEFFPQII